MAYIGKTPVIGNFQVCDAISVVNNQAAYTMQVGGVNVSPESANHMLVSLNGILQAPTSSFTVSGSTITFASNLVTGDVIDFIQILGNVLDLGVPSDATVSTAKIVDANVTSAKMFSGFANGITSASQFRLTTSFTGDASPIASNWEEVDTDGYGRLGTAVSQSSGIFTFPATGIWHIISVMTHIEGSAAIAYALNKIQTTENNSSYGDATVSYNSFEGNGYYMTNSSNFIFDVTDTSTHKVRLSTNAQDTSTTTMGDSDRNRTYITFIRLGDT